MESVVKLYSLPYSNVKTYGAALLFVIGNIALPQLFHLVPQGGMTWLPIYFFTLVGAYKYGWKVGLLTAIASPLINSALFGMPAPEVLPVILLKSVLANGHSLSIASMQPFRISVWASPACCSKYSAAMPSSVT